MNQPCPFKAARASSAIAAALVCLLSLLAPASAQQPANSNARRERTKRVTPLRTSDSEQGSRVTITSDGELNDYSAYRSGDRFIVVIPQAEGGGGAARGRGFEGAQVSRRGNDLVYTFKLEPGASARVNQRFNRLDVQFTTPKSAAQAGGGATPAATPRAQRTPETSGLPSPTPAARPTPDARAAAQQAAQQAAQLAAQQAAASPSPNVVPSGSPASAVTPPAAASPAGEPSAAPTAGAEQIAQAQPQPAAPGSAVVPPTNPPSGATLGATLVNNWPWIIAALLALGVGLLLVGRRGSRREPQQLTPPPARTAPALRETKAAPAAPAATPAAITTTPAATTPAAAPTATPVAKAATVAPIAEPPGKSKKKKGKGKAAAAPESQVATAKAEPSETVEAAGAAEVVEPAGAAGPPAPGADEVKIVDSGTTKAAAAPGATVVTPSKEIAVVAPAVDSERIGAEVKNLLAGESYDESVVAAADAETRQFVAAELSAALSGRNAERKERARAAFFAHGYFDAATRDLQSAEAPGRRAAAAHTLSLVGDRAATAHLVAALEDPAPDVRRSAVEALAELRDPAAVGPLEALRWREKSRQVPRPLIKRAIELCAEPAAADVDEAETTLVRETAAEAAKPAPAAAETAAPVEAETAATPAAETAAPTPARDAALEEATLEVATPEVEASEVLPAESASAQVVTPEPAKDEPASKEIELATAPPLFIDVSGQAAAREAEAVAPEVVAPEVEAVIAEGRAVEEGEAGAAGEAAAPVAEELPASVAGEATPVYTFDGAEAAAWAERHAASGREADMLAGLDAPRASGAESRESDGAGARPAYVAPEFALKGEEAAAKDSLKSDVALEQAAPADETPVVAAGEVAPVEASVSVTPAEPVGVAAEVPAETAVDAGAVKSVELFEEATAAPQPPAVAAAPAETSSAVDLFRPEEPAAAAPAARPHAEEVGIAPASEEDAAARGLAQAQDAATGFDLSQPEKGLSASPDDAAEISIIPKDIQLRLESDDSHERAESVLALARLNTDEAFTQICAAFDDRAEEVRAAAARALYEVAEDRAESFTRALREAPAERRRNIGAALASSGLADDAVSQLTGESRDRTYDAFSLLFLMAKAGETSPLIRAIESHPDNEVRLAVVKLLALSGQQEVLPSFRRLAVRGSLPTDVRAAVMEAIYQISSGGTAKTPAAPNR